MSLLARFRRPRVGIEEHGPLYEPVKEAMEEVQAYARTHGGTINLVGVSDEGRVTIRLGGTCRGCPLSAITVKSGVEQRLKSLVPGVTAVVQV